MPPDLLAAVLATPDDDGPRLVLADWLDEHGDPARAEFIRTQIAIAQFPKRNRGSFDRNELALLAREKTLLHKHGNEWLAPLQIRGGPLQSRSSHGQFIRGFIEIVWMSAATFLKRGDALMRHMPIRELRLTRMSPNEFFLLIALPSCRILATLDLSGRNLSFFDDDLTFADGDAISSLRRLRLRNCRLNDRCAEVIANCHYLWKLEELDVTDNPLTVTGITRLKLRYSYAVQFEEDVSGTEY